MLTILEGSTFCICDDIGDVGDETSGFFAEDTRFLSRLKLTVNGATPLPLSAGKVEYFSAAFFLRNPLAGGLRHGSALDHARAVRRRGDAGRRRAREPVDGPRRVRARARVRRGLRGHPLREAARLRARRSGDARSRCPHPVRRALRRRATTSSCSRTRRLAAHADDPLAARRGRRLQHDVSRSSSSRASAGRCGIDVVPVAGRRPLVPHDDRAPLRRGARARSRFARRVAAARAAAARRAGRSSSGRSASRSATSPRCGCGARRSPALVKLPAAGMPWFMTVFGRDTLITCLQTLLFGPELARNALAALAALQATEDDPSIDAEPGKIVHEVRRRQGGRELVRALLRHRRRDAALPDPVLGGVALDRRHHARAGVPGAGAARARVDRPLRRPRRRRLRRVREARAARARRAVVEGLVRLAALPRRPHRASGAIAPCEVQGYVYDAKRRLAEIAREVWRDRDARRAARRARPTSSSGDSTRRSGARTAAASTRSRSTATRTASTRSARTWATCSGRASSRRSASTPSSTS